MPRGTPRSILRTPADGATTHPAAEMCTAATAAAAAPAAAARPKGAVARPAAVAARAQARHAASAETTGRSALAWGGADAQRRTGVHLNRRWDWIKLGAIFAQCAVAISRRFHRRRHVAACDRRRLDLCAALILSLQQMPLRLPAGAAPRSGTLSRRSRWLSYVARRKRSVCF